MSDKLIPNTFQCPNAYLDELGTLLDDGEFKTLMYLVRHIYGWQDKIAKSRARLSLSKIANGFTTKEGNVYTGSGQSEQTVSRCLKALAKFGIIRQASKNNLANDGAEWELRPHSGIKFDELRARKTTKKDKTRTKTNTSIEAARAARRLNGSTSSESEGPLNRSTAGGLTVQPQVVERFNTTNPLKPNSNPLGGDAAIATIMESPNTSIAGSTESPTEDTHSTTYGNSHDSFCMPGKNSSQRMLYRLTQSGQEIDMVCEFLKLLPLKLSERTAKDNLSAAREILAGDGTVADMKRAWLDAKGRNGQRGFTVTDLWSLKGKTIALAAERKAKQAEVASTPAYQPEYN